uniref:DDE Tnp4 domain-containing protein n=1 Tax=Brassica oleracea var. oleracea TaxID=109376 RepID=A0A0D3B8C5_BRAOL
MTSSSPFNIDQQFDEAFDQFFEQQFDEAYDTLINDQGNQEDERNTRKKRVFIERNREEGNLRLWNDYFSDTPTYPENLFRRRFRMNKSLFMCIVDRLSNEVQFFRQKKDGLGRLGPKAALFAQRQEAVRKDVERAFGVLQARFGIIKNPARIWDKVKIGKIMRACIILHNMIVEDERDQNTQFDVSEFQQGEGNGSSHVNLTYSTDIPSNMGNMMNVRTTIRDTRIHERLKADLVEHM